MNQLNNDDFGREAQTVTQQGILDGLPGDPNAPPSSQDMNREQGVELTNQTQEAKNDGGLTNQDVKTDDSVPFAEPKKVSLEGLSDQDKMTAVMLKKLNKQFNKSGIEICDLQIQDVRLPKRTQLTVEAKTTIGTSRALEKMKQKKKILEIEYSNEKKLKIQEFGNEGEKIEERGKRQVAEVNNHLERERANTQKILRDTEEQSLSKIEQIKAETDKEIATLSAETKKIIALPYYTPDRKTAILCGGEELEGKRIVAENASQLIEDYTRGEGKSSSSPSLLLLSLLIYREKIPNFFFPPLFHSSKKYCQWFVRSC